MRVKREWRERERLWGREERGKECACLFSCVGGWGVGSLAILQHRKIWSRRNTKKINFKRRGNRVIAARHAAGEGYVHAYCYPASLFTWVQRALGVEEWYSPIRRRWRASSSNPKPGDIRWFLETKSEFLWKGIFRWKVTILFMSLAEINLW